jgi:hypothetical protein
MKFALPAVLVPLALASTATAAPIAADLASDAVYNDGWQGGDNGGFGFGPWNLFQTSSTGDRNGFFLGSSTGNGVTPSGGIDSAGRALGLYANQTADQNGLDIGYATAFRTFTNGEIGIGESLSLSMDNGNVGFWQLGPSLVGFSLNRFSFFFAGGETTYKIGYGDPNASIALYDTGVPFTDDGLGIVFTRTGADAFSLSVTPAGGSSVVISGVLPQTGGLLDSITLYNRTAGPGAISDLFFNDLQIIPEPTTLGVIGIASMLTLRRRGR